MKMAVVTRTIFLMVLFIFGSCSKVSTEELVALESFNVLELESELIQLTNEYRQSNGLTPVQFSSVAYSYANNHNDYMISKGSLSHDNFSSRASNIATEVEAKEVAENVAKDYLTAEATLKGWIDSAPHRVNLEGNFTHMAISAKKTENGDLYYTQIFFR